MEKCYERRLKLAEKFKFCRKAFIALGDETRQQMLIALLESDVHGIRVGEITKRTHLSRPAVSHHLQILKEAGVISMYRDGTKNYYYVNACDTVWKQLSELMNNINKIIEEVSKEDDCFKSEAEREAMKKDSTLKLL